MIFGIAYVLIGIGFGAYSWDRSADDSQNFAAMSLSILAWPLILVAGLAVAVVQASKK